MMASLFSLVLSVILYLLMRVKFCMAQCFAGIL